MVPRCLPRAVVWGCPVWTLLGCSGGRSDTAGKTVHPEQPIELSSSPEAIGVPVGVRTVEHNGVTLEVWYPAVDLGESQSATPVEFEAFIPDSYRDAIDGFELPLIEGVARPEAAIRNAGQPLPLVLFSHGFGGMRIQSFGLTTHLASRGYVVVAPDHPGRMLTDVLPCIFSPPLEGCDLSGFGADPGPDGLAAALEWADQASSSGPFEDRIDVGRIGVMGHSAGAGSATIFAADEARVDALAPLSGGDVPSRELATLRMDGSCDGFVPAADPSSIDGFPRAEFVTVHGAGHLAFTNLCELDINGFAERFLDDRDDLNSILYPQLKGLGTDGCDGAVPQVEQEDCPDSFLSIDASDSIVRYHTTVFFDRELKGVEPSEVRAFDAATVYLPKP